MPRILALTCLLLISVAARAGGFHAPGYLRPIVGRDSQAGQCEKGRGARSKAIVAAFIEVQKFHLILIGGRNVCRNFSNLRTLSR